MITYIICVFLFVWLIYKRSREDGKIEGLPFGMPHGSVRAIIALLIVSFPFHYILLDKQIPDLITNVIFLIVAFYFEARKGGEEDIRKIVKHIINPEKYTAEKTKQKSPLYLPKYSVRISLITLLSLTLIINSLGPNISFVSKNTFADLLLIIFLFIIGTLIRGVANTREKRRIRKIIQSMEGSQMQSKQEILEKVIEKKESWLKRKWSSFVSLLILTSVFVALILYTIDVDFLLFSLSVFQITLAGLLLLMVSVYFGLRD